MPITTVDGLDVVALTIALAAIYLSLLRLVDVNEKEPAWALGLLFGAGAGAGSLLYLLVPGTTLDLTLVVGPLLKVVTIVLALVAGLAMIDVIGRGGSQVSGPLDGLMYGAAAGLGFITGAAFVQQLLLSQPGTVGLVPEGNGLAALLSLALSGLAYGVYGALAGAGIAAAVVATSARRMLLSPAVGIMAAGVAAVGYAMLAYAGTLAPGGQLRAVAALLLPVLALAALALLSLRAERRAIAAEVDAEVDAGTIRADEARLLRNPAARRAAYWGRLRSGDIDGWGDLRSLHNHQVRLLLSKHRAAHTSDPGQSKRAEQDIARLRAAVAAIRAENPDFTPTTNPTPVGG